MHRIIHTCAITHMSSSIHSASGASYSVGRANAAPRLQTVGAFILRYSLVFFLLFFGALKWTAAEAQGIQPMVSHSPFLSWLYPAFSVQHGSEVIGVVELVIGVLIATRRWSPRASAVGSLAASGMFLITLSFLFTTPNAGESAPFLLKDLTLLGAALWTAGEAVAAS